MTKKKLEKLTKEELIEMLVDKTGEWKKPADTPWLNECSRCGYRAPKATAYCPVCGSNNVLNWK